jgi:putative pyruvate formate lyase activating enzyme
MPPASRRKFISASAAAALAPVLGSTACSISGCGSGSGNGNSDGQAEQNPPADVNYIPSYVGLHASGELKRRGEILYEMMRECRLCPRECGVDRIAGERGFCGASSQLVVSSFNPHFGEETPLVGRGGSGTIFMSHCGLRCVFCINGEISHSGKGSDRDIQDLALMMLALARKGCHNINIVTPTHYSPHVLLALDIAAANGLAVPLVWNTCGWERLEILEILDGVVDIYLPDFKYADGAMAARYSAGASSYPEVTQTALLEMHRQVGVAQAAADGIMRRGLMIRHLVMPGGVSGSKDVMRWIADNLPNNTYINIMSQYRPMYKASGYPEINRRIRRKEYAEVVDCARELGLSNLDIQGYPFM